MDDLREAIALLDENGEFIFVNDAFTEIVGYETAELLGECWENVYPDDQVERIDEEILPAAPAKGYLSGDTMYRRKDECRILVNYTHVYSEGGTLIYLLRDFSDDDYTSPTR